MLHVWLGLGDSEFTVRSLSVLFAVATVPAMYLLGSRLFGPVVGVVAGLLMATNDFWLDYAQEARAYSLVLLLVTLSSYAFILAIERNTTWRWAAYLLLSALAVYAHFFAALVVFSHVTSVAVLRKQDIPWRNLSLSMLTA